MQDTKELTTPVSGKKVLIRAYVSGLIDDEVGRIKAAANKTSFVAPAEALNDADPTKTDSFPPGTEVKLDIDPTVQYDADKKLLELMVLAVDGDNGDAYNKLMNLPAPDVQFVKDEVKKLASAGQVSDPKAQS